MGDCLMPGTRCSLLSFAILAGLAASVHAQLYENKTVKTEIALPSPAEVQKLGVFPEKIVLSGQDDAAQLVVTGTVQTDRLQDLSGNVAYQVANPALARVTSAGRVLPLANGTTEITA